jgi:hypothetical protein
MTLAPLTALFALALQDAPVKITVVDREGGKPIFARVVLKNDAGRVIGSTGYQTLNGRFVPPDGWTVTLPRGRYSIRADAGFEFFAHDESWDFEGAAEKRIELRRWVHFRKEGWLPGGDHNHLIRGGAENKNYDGTTVTLEFAAALQASRGWSYYLAGGGGPWLVEADPRQPLHNGRRTEAAAAAWNRKYAEHLHLGWNNEILKTRYGHVWFIGHCPSGPTYPYTDQAGDAWWAFYDDSWDPWQTGDRSKPIGPLKSGLWDLPPTFDCIRSWRDRGLVSIYAHPTRTFMIGKNRVSNIAVEFPFDLLAGAPVGGLAVMGDAPDHPQDQALWFAALNEGYRVPGIAENDTVYGSDAPRAGPHVTYTFAPGAAAPFDLPKVAEALGAGRNFVSSGAFCTLRADGRYGPGDVAPESGKPHELEVRAWASADPADVLDALEIVADGRVVERLAAAAGRREFSGKATVGAAGWVLAKAVCRNRGAVAITNPIYFRKPGAPAHPEPLRSTVSGRATLRGAGVPAEIVVRVWGKEVSRSRAGADGTYRLEDVPIAAHLEFTHGDRSARRTILFHDPRIAALHARIWSTEFAGQPGALGGAFPPDFFRMLRDLLRETTLDAALGD